MKRIVAALAVAAVFVAGAAMAVTPVQPTHKAVKGEEYHHLLMLDVREAGEHARTLQHYALTHEKNLDRAVVTKHVDELSRNLDGVQTELAQVEQQVGTSEKPSMQTSLNTIGDQQKVARENLDLLRTELAKTTPEASVIAQKSEAIAKAMAVAGEHHRRIMTKRGVHEVPATTKP